MAFSIGLATMSRTRWHVRDFAQLLSFSFLFVLLAFGPNFVRAHAIDSAYGVFFVDDESDNITFKIQTNYEAIIAGIDPWLEDTDHSPNAPEYNRLRELPPDELSVEFERITQDLLDGINLEFDGQRVPVRIIGQKIPEVGDLEVSRLSELSFSADIPDGAEGFTFGWAERYGAITIRSIGPRTRITHIERIETGETGTYISLADVKARTSWQMIRDFMVIGFEHIVPKGLDHILFVVGIFLLSTKLRPILTQVTTFTIAHTVTLGLGAAGWVNIPPSIVEPLIAASIVYVAVENIFMDRLSPWRPALVFAFGLLHGLGFAGILREFNVAPADFIVGLLSFNVGVEIGQLTVIAACFLLVGFWFGNKPWYRRVIVIPGSAFIAAIATYWFFERVFG